MKKKTARKPKAVMAWGAVFRDKLTGFASRDRSAASMLGIYPVIRVRIVPVERKARAKNAE